MILAIDPGTRESGIVYYDPIKREPVNAGIYPNETIMLTVMEASNTHDIVIEEINSYGMPVGREVFETCIWIGRFVQAVYERSANPVHLIPRREVKLHICQSPRANDASINNALWDIYGGSQQAAKGTKKNPGPLYGFNRHMYPALALAITFAETPQHEEVAA